MLSNVFFIGKDIVKIKAEHLKKLKIAARKNPLKRARLCLHKSHRDQIQEMVIALCQGSYVRPHRHFNKSESFHVIEGEMKVIIFNAKGKVIKKIEMGPLASGKIFMFRLNSKFWHMVIPSSKYVIVHETTCGPFKKGNNFFAPWSPKYNDEKAIKIFQEQLKGAIK